MWLKDFGLRVFVIEIPGTGIRGEIVTEGVGIHDIGQVLVGL